MELSKNTVEVLKVFSTINSNLLIVPGKTLKTVSVARNIVAFADVDEEFEQEFGIYNTVEFLGALSLFKEPVLSFNDAFVTVSDKNSSFALKYIAADKSILHYPTKDAKVPAFDAEFTISEADLSTVLKGAAIIGAPDIQVIGNDKGTFIKVCDRKNRSSNDMQIKVNDDAGEFAFNLKVANLKLYPGDHTVGISAKGLSMWENKAAKVRVFIALEAK